MLSFEKVGKLNIPVVIGIVVIHMLAVMACLPIFFTTSGLALFVFFYCVTALGITLCFHRLLTHNSFKTPQWFRYFLTLCGTLAFQGSVMTWVGTHRIHHKHSDKPGDPHSPKHGFSWAHMFWFMYKHPAGNDPRDAAKDLQKDSGLVFIDRYFWFPQVALTILLFGLGFWSGGIHTAMSWIVWGIGLRTAAAYHAAWLVNSACHTWGYRNFTAEETGDDSRNNIWLALFTFGESFHNNHHGEPRSAAHGNRRWYEFDITYQVIKILGKVGLVSDIKKPEHGFH